jgi:ubiquinone/menaquinone biosynthesis C-methylase UbiE
MALDTAQFRQMQRKVWSSGDWPEFASVIQPVADELVERLAIADGEDVLDVGTGTGNAAIRAAERGARVTGVDITPELFDAARERASEAEVEIDWVEGDAAELPVPDQASDAVLSVFGCMFAPRHQDAADELVRVTRPGGRFGVCAWTPEGLNGRFLGTIGAAMPPPPPEAQPPILWGSEDHVTELFAGKDVELTFERAFASWTWESPEAWIDYCEEKLGPMVMAKAVLEPQGKWEELRASVLELAAEGQSTNGEWHAESEYLRTVGTVKG